MSEREDYLVACSAAQAEKGTLLINVFCKEHAVPFGEVCASSRGPTYVTPPRVLQELRRRDIADRSSRGNRRARSGTYTGGYLFDHPDRPIVIETWCQIGGDCILDPAPLATLVAEALSSPNALKYTVDCR